MNTEQERAFEQILHSVQQAQIPGNDWRRELKLIESTCRAALQSQDREACSWPYDESDGAHQTSCGNMHIIIDGTPDDNGMKYCCYCGGRITPAIDHARRVEGEASDAK